MGKREGKGRVRGGKGNKKGEGEREGVKRKDGKATRTLGKEVEEQN